jgi:hypothetical protein
VKNLKAINIINEEIQKFLINESYIVAGDNFNFKQPIKNAFFYNYNGFSSEFDVNITQSNISITWQVTFTLNDMGIENFNIDIEGVEGIYVVEYYDKHTDELKQRTQKNVAEDQWKYVVNEQTTLLLGKTLYVKDLEFDFDNKLCKVNF